MREKKSSIAPEVEHLLAAVNAVKRGLIPEKAQIPLPDVPPEELEETSEGDKD
jgi:hypothetical protein